MNKKIILTLSALLTLGSPAAFCAGVNSLQPIDGNASNTPSYSSSILDKKTVYYPNANIKSAAAKYKKGNYTGCLQELYSLTKKDPSNALAYYYMAMAYTHLNMKDDAVKAYEKVLSLNPNSFLVQYATKGRDCLTDGPACKPPAPPKEEEKEEDALDKFINSPYGNGFSPELNQEIKQKELKNIQETINKKENLDNRDIQKIKNIDNGVSSEETNDKIAQVDDKDVLKAIQTLKEAGVNVTIQPAAYSQVAQDPRTAEMEMLLGNNNSNNSNSMMMNMLPMLMSQAKSGQNVDPRIMQAMMMSSMMSDMNSNNNNNY